MTTLKIWVSEQNNVYFIYLLPHHPIASFISKFIEHYHSFNHTQNAHDGKTFNTANPKMEVQNGGAESIHASFNSIECSYLGIPKKVDRLS